MEANGIGRKLENEVIEFSINYVTSYGEGAYVIGNIPEFGEWQISRAFKLKWTRVRLF